MQRKPSEQQQLLYAAVGLLAELADPIGLKTQYRFQRKEPLGKWLMAEEWIEKLLDGGRSSELGGIGGTSPSVNGTFQLMLNTEECIDATSRDPRSGTVLSICGIRYSLWSGNEVCRPWEE